LAAADLERFTALCSTPCGINGIFAWALEDQTVRDKKCSTPCGINGIFAVYR
jgi:hypothetical protein